MTTKRTDYFSLDSSKKYQHIDRPGTIYCRPLPPVLLSTRYFTVEDWKPLFGNSDCVHQQRQQPFGARVYATVKNGRELTLTFRTQTGHRFQLRLDAKDDPNPITTQRATDLVNKFLVEHRSVYMELIEHLDFALEDDSPAELPWDFVPHKGDKTFDLSKFARR